MSEFYVCAPKSTLLEPEYILYLFPNELVDDYQLTLAFNYFCSPLQRVFMLQVKNRLLIYVCTILC